MHFLQNKCKKVWARNLNLEREKFSTFFWFLLSGIICMILLIDWLCLFLDIALPQVLPSAATAPLLSWEWGRGRSSWCPAMYRHTQRYLLLLHLDYVKKYFLLGFVGVPLDIQQQLSEPWVPFSTPLSIQLNRRFTGIQYFEVQCAQVR